MDELSLFAIAGTTSSSVQTAAPTDPVNAAPTPSDGEKFSAALKAAVPTRNVDDVNGRGAAADESPVEGTSAGTELETETIDTQLVWAVDNTGFISADRNLLPADVPAPATLPRAADNNQTPDDASTQLPEILPVPEAAALPGTPLVEATTVSGPFVTDTAPTDTSLLPIDAVSVSGTQNVELLNNEAPDARRSLPTTETHIPGTRLEVPQTQQRNVSSEVRDSHVAVSSQVPESSTDAPQQQRRPFPASSAGPVLSPQTPTSARLAAVPHATTASVPVAANPASKPEPIVFSEPTAPAAQTDRIPTVLTHPPVNNGPISDRVPAVLNSADLAVPGIPSTTDAVSPAAEVIPTETVSPAPTSHAQRVAPVLTPLPDAVATGTVARIPAILRNPTEEPPSQVTPGSAGELSGIARPISVTGDLLSSDVTTATSIIDEVLQPKSPEVSAAPAIEASDVTTAILPSPAAESGSSPRLNVPQPLTSQVLVAMTQNLSVVREQSSGTLTLRLDPPELGQMEVQFRQSDQGVELRLAARVPETLQMLLSRGDEISRALNTMDLDFSKLEIAGDDGFRGGGESAAFEHSSSQQSESEQQYQGPGLDDNPEDDDQGGRSESNRQNSRSRRRPGIRA